MGLDMYLTKKTYVKNWDHMGENQKHKITIKLGGKVREDIKPERISYITEEVGYWRKANQIHKWFVDNCQGGVDDCREAYVTREQLKELYDTCKKVRASIELVDAKVKNGSTFKGGKEIPCMEDGKKIKNSKTAQKLLPTQSGFFFGGDGYDQWYVEDIENTIIILEGVLAEEDGDYYYHSSW